MIPPRLDHFNEEGKKTQQKTKTAADEPTLSAVTEIS